MVGERPGRTVCRPGAGPGGLRPILLERGRDVDSRRADVERFRTTGLLDTASNVQFGEGAPAPFQTAS